MSAAQVVSVSATGQLVIPASLRQRVGLRNAGRVLVRVDAGRIILDPVPAGDAGRRRWRGALRGERALEQLVPEHRAAAAAGRPGRDGA